MKFLSVCSGIEAASVAWVPLGWECVATSEIEKFPARVVEYHFNTPNWGDMNDFKKWPDADFDVLVGGTPCQSFSVAGLRAGLEDPRGNLALVYLAILDRYRPEWLVWENVPGVLSSEEGRDFGAIIGGMVELGYSPSWRVLNAQFFGVPQRRRRVFVVGHLGDWRRSAAVLFESSCLRRDNPPSRSSGEGLAGSPSAGAGGGRGVGADLDLDGRLTRDTAHALAAGGNLKHREDQDTLVAEPPEKWPAEVASTLNAAYGTKQGLEDQHALGGAALFVPANPDIVGALTAKGPTALGAPEVDANHYIVSSGQANASITKEIAPALDCLHEAPILAGDKPKPIYVQDVADPLTANEQKTYTHEGSTFRTRNVTAFAPDVAAPLSAGSNPNSNAAGRRREDDDNLAVTLAITENQRSEVRLTDVTGAVQAGGGKPGQGYQAVMAFKPSHYTRGKDGAPSDIVPPLSADADKGDQDPIVFEERHYTRNDRGPPSDIVPPLKATAPKGDAAPVVAYGMRSDASRSGEAKNASKDAEGRMRKRDAGFNVDEELCPTVDTSQGHTVAHSIRTAHTAANGCGIQEELVPALDTTNGPAVAFTASDMSNKAAWEKPYNSTLDAQVPNDASNIQKGIRSGMIVRRLTPTECERLQGFPDGYTDIPGASDSARYKALGNSMAVPVMRWIGERIDKVSKT